MEFLIDMRPETLQNTSNILIVVGVVLTALGGYGAYHFGEKASNQKDIAHQTNIDELKNKVTLQSQQLEAQAKTLEQQSKDAQGFAMGMGLALFKPILWSPLVMHLGLSNQT